MPTPARPLIVGNWKMNGLSGALAEAGKLAETLTRDRPAAIVVICPPATLLDRMSKALSGCGAALGAQDCHFLNRGAFTGEISPEMMADAGASYVILGHSERRIFHGEADEVVAVKVRGAVRAGLTPIICVGETLDEREEGRVLEVIAAQVTGSAPLKPLSSKPFCIAYEPCWAIGTGRVPTAAQIAQAHGAIRQVLLQRFGGQGAVTPILYGGSVKPANAREILRIGDVDGALVGGASLNADDFRQIVHAAQ